MQAIKLVVPRWTRVQKPRFPRQSDRYRVAFMTPKAMMSLSLSFQYAGRVSDDGHARSDVLGDDCTHPDGRARANHEWLL